eukprot:s11_g38.t1
MLKQTFPPKRLLTLAQSFSGSCGSSDIKLCQAMSYANWVDVPVIDLSDEEPQLDGELGGGTIEASGVSTGELTEDGGQSKEVQHVNAEKSLLKPLKSVKRPLEMVPEEPERAKRHCDMTPVEVVNFTRTIRTPGTAIFGEANEDFLVHLRENGFAILQGVLGDAGHIFRDEFWKAMTKVVPDLDIGKQHTWNFPKGFRGIVTSYGLPHADFAWMVRAHPRIREAFASIFGTKDLVVSLDAVIAQAQNSKSKLPGWLHKDQHPNHKGLSVQAVYTHFGSGPHDAGTCVVPGSHKVTFPWEWRAKGDHLRAPEDAALQPALQPLKPDVPPDSVVFFNSRLLHASVCGTGHVCGRPARLGVCVAYAPVARRSEQTRRKKEKAYLQGKCSSHWPCDKFALKPPIKSFQILKGAVSLPPPQPLKERLLLL